MRPSVRTSPSGKEFPNKRKQYYDTNPPSNISSEDFEKNIIKWSKSATKTDGRKAALKRRWDKNQGGK